jgi:MFS family permease
LDEPVPTTLTVRRQVVSLAFVGGGMGLIDGATPALLADESERIFGVSSGKIFVLSNMAVQMGFVAGPLVGNSIVQAAGFTINSLLCGALLAVYALVFCRRRASASAAPGPGSGEHQHVTEQLAPAAAELRVAVAE